MNTTKEIILDSIDKLIESGIDISGIVGYHCDVDTLLYMKKQVQRETRYGKYLIDNFSKLRKEWQK